MIEKEKDLRALLAILPAHVMSVCQTLHRHGYEAFIVGGALRNYFLGKAIGEIDLATNARPDQVMTIFKRVKATGVRYGTVTVFFEGKTGAYHDGVEVTTYRSESVYSDSRHPDSIQFETTIEADLKRRDFTMNALAFDPVSLREVDLFGGRRDIQLRVLRCVGKPELRFQEDSLRLFRACRFQAEYPLKLDAPMVAAGRRVSQSVLFPSAERIYVELKKLMSGSFPEKGWRALKKMGVLRRLDSMLDSQAEELFDGLSSYQDVSLRWAFILQHTDAGQFLRRNRFSKKEGAWIARLIRFNLDIEHARLSVKDLAVSGKDLMALGLSGRQIGKVQRMLLDALRRGGVLNDKASLLSHFKLAYNRVDEIDMIDEEGLTGG